MALYPTQDDAARAALNDCNRLSIRNNREYRGYIYRTTDGRFGYTFPMMGGMYGTNLDIIHTPPNTSIVGEYHTHGDYTGPGNAPNSSVRTTRENAWRGSDFRGHVGPTADIFGPEDIPGARARGEGIRGYRSYLGTAGGVFHYYDVDSNRQGTL